MTHEKTEIPRNKQSEASGGPCPACYAWREDACELLRRGDAKALFRSGNCDLPRAIESWIDHYIRIRCPGAEGLRDDLVQDVQLVLHAEGFSFPDRLIPNATHLRRWLRTLVLNRATDFLRRERVMPKVRCGACLYLSVQAACSLATVRAERGSEAPNPHYEKKLDPHTNPSSLVPPCRDFFWRYRRSPLDELSRKEEAPSKAAERGETENVLQKALHHLLKSGATGRRQAYVLHEHFTNEVPATTIAEELEVSERTIRRDIAAGLKELQGILKERFGLTRGDFA